MEKWNIRKRFSRTASARFTLRGGMVRFDFVTLQPNENGAAPTPVVNERIIMPPQGFLGAFNSMQQLIDKLLEAGVLQKNEQAK